MVPEQSGPRVILSYDVSADRRPIASQVSHVIFGRGDEPAGGPIPFIQRPGVVWLGQSVLLMPRSTARELAVRLEGMGARVAMANVEVNPDELEAFRRRMRRHLGS